MFLPFIHSPTPPFILTDSTAAPPPSPSSFCAVYRDWEGNPVDLGEQQDANEFLNFLFDRVDSRLQSVRPAELLRVRRETLQVRLQAGEVRIRRQLQALGALGAGDGCAGGDGRKAETATGKQMLEERLARIVGLAASRFGVSVVVTVLSCVDELRRLSLSDPDWLCFHSLSVLCEELVETSV